jgi:hypothetical protein
MATTTTYFTALDTIITFAKDNGFDNEDVIAKLEKLRDQKATKPNNGRKSPARKANETLVGEVVATMRHKNVTEVRAGWLRDNVKGINTVPKAVAVLNVGMDMGVFNTRRVEKSATRSELVYFLVENVDEN